MDVRLIGLTYVAGNVQRQPSAQDMEQVAREIEALFPIPRLNRDTPYYLRISGQPTTGPEFADINRSLQVHRLLDGCITSWPINCKKYYLGILVGTSNDVAGRAADIPSDVAAAYITTRFTPSHELGHSTGRFHTSYTGGEAGPDRNYHPPDGTISSDKSDAGFFGFNIFDITTGGIYGPNTSDLMSYGQRRWIMGYFLRCSLDTTHLLRHWKM
jgi:hypothetical protein